MAIDIHAAIYHPIGNASTTNAEVGSEALATPTALPA